MKILNVKPFLFLFVLSFLGEGRSLALADTAIDKCTFISPFAMQEHLKKTFIHYKDSTILSLLDYIWHISISDKSRLYKCEKSLLNEENINIDKKNYLFENHKRALMGPGIEGGDYIKRDLYSLSVCQIHACISNIHSDIFDRKGHLLATILYLYPSPDTSSPEGQQLADILDGKHKEHYYPLEAWVGIRKEYNTPELRTFIKEAFENLQKGSGATIVAVHGMPKE